MKKNQQRSFWLGLFTFVLLFALIFGNQIITKLKPSSPLLFPFNKKQVTKINVINSNNTTTLQSKNNKWFVLQNKVEFIADQERIDQILDSLSQLKKNEIVSNNKERQSEFGIGSSMIEFSTKDKNWKLYLGKNYSSSQIYVKTENNSDIFLAKNLEKILYPEDYRDLNLHLITDENKITQIELNDNVNKLVLVKKDNKWFIGDKEAKKDRVDFLINDLKTLSANDIIEAKQQLPDFPDFTVTIKADKQKNISTYRKDETNSWAMIDNHNSTYVVSSVYLDGLKKTETDLTQ